MTQAEMLAIAGSLVAAMFGILATVLGWIGSRAIARMDAMGEKIGDKLDNMAGELHTRINGLDMRLTRVETIVEDK